MSRGYMVTVRFVVDANYGIDSPEKALMVVKHKTNDKDSAIPSDMEYAAHEGVLLIGYTVEELG